MTPSSRISASQEKVAGANPLMVLLLISVLPCLVIVYALGGVEALSRLGRPEALMLGMALLLIQAGGMILRQQAAERCVGDRHVKTPISGDPEITAIRREASDLSRMAGSFGEMAKRCEEATSRLEQRHTELMMMKKAVETIRTGISITDLSGKILYVNPVVAEMHGYEQEELLGEDSGIFAPPGFGREVSTRGLLPAEAQMRDSMNVRKDGSIFPVFRISDLVIDEHGEPVGIVTTYDDPSDGEKTAEALRKSRDLYHTLVESLPDVIYQVAADGRIVSLNSAFEKLTGWTVRDTIGKPYADLIHPEDMPAAMRYFQEIVVEGRIPPPVDLRVCTASGRYLVGEFTGVPLREDGTITGELGIARDVTKHRELEDELIKQLAAIEASIDGIGILNREERYVYLNNAHAQIYGYDSPRHLIGKSWETLYEDEERGRFRQEIMPVLWKNGQWRGRARGKKSDGTSFLQEVSLTLIEGKYTVCVVRDITEFQCNVEKLEHVAYYDPLTGLPNRLLFNDRLGKAMLEAHCHKKLVGIMFLDLDRFKSINDTLGHNVGDLLISAVAQRLKGCISAADIVTRLGGDEFLMLFAGLNHPQDAAITAQKIIGSLSKPFVLDGHEVYVTVSIGISMFPTDGDDVTTLIKNADIAMYHAKEQGRDNYQFYNAAMNAAGLEMLTLESGLHKALKRKELVLHYQPQFDLRSGRITGVEALLRWQHPDFGLLPPGDFIALAEETGVIVPIGEWLIGAACEQIRRWQAIGLSPGRIAVNLSMRQFKQKDLAEMIGRILRETGLTPEFLELELTEGIVMQNPESTIATLRELRSLGVHLSIDDFGTGYSSLNYLKYLPINKLKIAHHFADGITKDPNDEAITRAIITLAHSLNLTVIAEGVETTDQLEFLRMHECDEAQGYLLSRPLPVEELERVLSEISQVYPHWMKDAEQ